MIICNQVECLVCGDRPFSAHRHDFQTCKCGNVSVDGGCDYLKRAGKGFYKELSLDYPEEFLDKVIGVCQEMLDTGRNARGVCYGVFRAIRDEGAKIEIQRTEEF